MVKKRHDMGEVSNSRFRDLWTPFGPGGRSRRRRSPRSQTVTRRNACGACSTFWQASVLIVQRREPTMNNDLFVIGLVVMFGGALSYVGLIASQLVEKRHAVERARIDARRYDRRLHLTIDACGVDQVPPGKTAALAKARLLGQELSPSGNANIAGFARGLRRQSSTRCAHILADMPTPRQRRCGYLLRLQ